MALPVDDLDVVVLGGAGHVGLPLSLAFADAGLSVGIYDTNRPALDLIASRQMPFRESGADEILARVNLEPSDDPSILGRTSRVVIVIGTPADFSLLVDEIGPYLRLGSLVVLRSTVAPGTTAYVADRLPDCAVAFCPERIAEGHAIEELRTLPQIIGADIAAAGNRAESLFASIAPKTLRTTTQEAELAKLFANSWRYLKFAAANQFYMIADGAGIDYGNVLRAMRTDYPRAADIPNPGFAAGPCLPKDTRQLAEFANFFPLGEAALHVNEGMPAYVTWRAGDLTGKTVGILGMAFKAESDDARTSLGYSLRDRLVNAGARVLCTDPYVKDDSLVSLDDTLEQSDILVLGVPHRAYRNIRADIDIWHWA